MRTSTAALWGTLSALAACGGKGDATATVEPAAAAHDEWLAPLPPKNTVVGPVCPECLSAGGETSDFDGGRAATCADYLVSAPASDADAELAGYDVAAYRSRLTRSFETSLRWTDLTASSAQPRSTPIAGYTPETVVRGSVTTGGIERAVLDPAQCGDAAQCRWGPIELDCTSHSIASYSIATEVALATDDGAIEHVFHSAILLEPSLPDANANAPSRGVDAALSFAAHVDLADVQGTLRIEPLPEAKLGTLALWFGYLADSVRGQLVVNLGNDSLWRTGSGSSLEPVDDRPLRAHFPADHCAPDVLPAPLDEPHADLSGHVPADELAALGASIAAADTTALWSPTGPETTLRAQLRPLEYACIAYGRITNVPLRLSTADGKLAWSVLATYELADDSAGVPHRLSLEQELHPDSSMWAKVFGAFSLAPDTERAFARFRGEYPTTSAEVAPSAAPGRAVFEIVESNHCQNYQAACLPQTPSACLVAPAGAECGIAD
jgi:hypothetical protein